MATLSVRCYLLLLLACPLGAQDLSAVISPNPAPLAGPVTVTVTAGAMPVIIGGCVISAVHQGSPLGPNVLGPILCIAIVQTIPACGSLSATWNTAQPSGVLPAPGDYWIEIQVLGVGTLPASHSEFFPVTLSAAPSQEATLLALTPAQIGQPLLLGIQAPLAGGGGYIAAASFTSNVGIPITATQFLALDNDALFNLTFPFPDPSLFANLQGSLDAAGSNNSIGMFIPNVPFLQCTGLVWQAAVFGAGGLELTNALSFTIQ